VERLAAASAGHRILDCHIEAWRMALTEEVEFRTVGHPTYETERYFCGPKAMDWIGYDLLRTAPAYTASLDAALGLAATVLPGWRYQLDIAPGGSCVLCFDGMGLTDDESHEGQTPALALCLAVLKATTASSVGISEGNEPKELP